MMVEGTKNGEILRGLLRLQEIVVLGLRWSAGRRCPSR